MTVFQIHRNRDAYPTIRGYVYQVNLTIKRWLALQEDQLLELESGEDIDLVSNYFSETQEEQSRLLEQIKHSEKKVTLKTEGVKVAIANAFQHFKSNPNHDLIFRYTTSSEVGVEQLSPFVDREPGITAWQEICLSSVISEVVADKLHRLRSFMLTLPNPRDFPEEIWNSYTQFLRDSSDEELKRFLSRFEWSVGTSDTEELSEEIKRTLITDYQVVSLQEAQLKYETLFFHVFNILSKQGAKRLLLSDLSEQLSSTPVMENSETVKRIFSTLDAMRTEIAELQQQYNGLETVQNQQALRLLTIESLIKYQDQQAISLQYSSSPPILDPPSMPAVLTHRPATVTDLIQRSQSHLWTAIYGVKGSGKTQLVSLLTAKLKTKVQWIRFSEGDNSISVAEGLDKACTEILQLPVSYKKFDLYQQFCASLGSHALIVLDNLPKFDSDDVLAKSLDILVRTCRTTQTRLISTSLFAPPFGLETALGASTLLVLPSPEFTDDEVIELFQHYGAPNQTYTRKTYTSFNAIAKSHPLLLCAIAGYLSKHNWAITNEVFDGLFFKQAHTQDLNQETLQQLIRLVDDEADRDLLYRLNLINATSFTTETVQNLAKIEPVIARPLERLNKLSGYWVFRDVVKNNNWTVTPLLKMLGSVDLSENTLRNCCIILAEEILNRGNANQYDVNIVMAYFAQAGEEVRAARLLLQMLVELERSDKLVNDTYLILSYWYGLPLPLKLELDLKLLLRAYQIKVCRKYGKDTSYLISDLEQLLLQAGSAEWKALLIVAEKIPQDADTVNRYTKKALQALPQSGSSDVLTHKELFDSKEFSLVLIVWLHVLTLREVEAVSGWLANLELLNKEQQQTAFTSIAAEEGAWVIATNLWINESNKPPSQQNWPRLLTDVEKLITQSQQLGFELLWACFVRAKIIIQGEYMKNLGAAIDTGQAALQSSFISDPRSFFIIQSTIGQQLIYQDQKAAAYIWLDKALNQPTEVYPEERVITLLWTGIAASNDNSASSIPYYERAVQLSSVSNKISEFTAIKVWLEAGIAFWSIGEYWKAYVYFNDAANRLLDMKFRLKTDEDQWKGLYRLLGFFLVSIVEQRPTNDPANQANPVTSQNIKPGLSLCNLKLFVSLYNEQFDSFVPFLLSTLAEGLDKEDEALAWASRGLDIASTGKPNHTLYYHILKNISPLILSDRYVDVIGGATMATAIGVVLTKQNEEGQIRANLEIDLDGELGIKPNEQWNIIEHNSLLFNIIPIIFRLGGLDITAPGEAKLKATEVIALCRQYSITASNQQLWRDVAELIDQIFITRSGYKQLTETANNYQSKGQNNLQAIAALGAMLAEDVTPEDNLRLQCVILPYFDFQYRKHSVYKQLLWPFISSLWISIVKRQGFRFNLPKMVVEDIIELKNGSAGNAILDLLKIVGKGLHARPSDIEQYWLQNSYNRNVSHS